MKLRYLTLVTSPTAGSAFAAFACCLLLTEPASAQQLESSASSMRDHESVSFTSAEHDDELPSYRLSLRPSLGLGGGSQGIGGRIGVAADYWLSDTIGLGLHGAALGQSEILGDRSDAMTLALAGSLRSAPRGSYFFLALGAGYARATHTQGDGCIELFGTCPEPDVIRYDGYTVTSALGFLGHPGRSWFEIGPVVRLDVVGDPQGRVPADFLVTVNLTLGYGLLR